jgi:hypothetical protein
VQKDKDMLHRVKGVVVVVSQMQTKASSEREIVPLVQASGVLISHANSLNYHVVRAFSRGNASQSNSCFGQQMCLVLETFMTLVV